MYLKGTTLQLSTEKRQKDKILHRTLKIEQQEPH
jgi:hypothetical protein